MGESKLKLFNDTTKRSVPLYIITPINSASFEPGSKQRRDSVHATLICSSKQDFPQLDNQTVNTGVLH